MKKWPICRDSCGTTIGIRDPAPAGFIAVKPDDIVFSIEMPMAGDPRPPLERARDIRRAAMSFFGGQQ